VLIEQLKSIAKKLWKKYKAEIVLTIISFLIVVISTGMFFVNQNRRDSEIEIATDSNQSLTTSSKIHIDVAGAVNKPDVYQVTFGARLKDVLTMAGGLSDEADKNFFSRNYNLAKILVDQEKIFVPSTTDLNSGLFIESQRTLDYNQPQNISFSSDAEESINVNSASLEELDTLAGIGKTTAEKIIRGRPYKSLDELITNKILNQSVYEKIKNLISVN